jgi:phosphatidate cytidylyltransferase
VFGVGAALIVACVARFVLHTATFEWSTVVIYGVVVGAVAQLGDLMESMIKRDCQRKDASTVVPGFGGVLDVLDSVIFAGPIAYAFWLGFGS